MNVRHLLGLLGAGALSCATGGSAWLNRPLATSAWGDAAAPRASGSAASAAAIDPQGSPPDRVRSRVLKDSVVREDTFFVPEGAPPPGVAGAPLTPSNPAALGGRTLGTFRNTYYDFPNEAEFSGRTVALKNPRCNTIKNVALAFYESVCVQGSGTLSSGSTVSFAKRDCECAEVCPRTQQRICFDELDARAFPWGRGATGRAITPLLTVAVDSDLIPLDTPVYIPEFDGVPRDPSRSALHDGCFIAQDRGVRVKGEHIDVFTGQREITALWNSIVPSNRGVTVVLGSPHCARAVVKP